MRISISNLVRRFALPSALVLSACAGDSPAPVNRRCTKALYELCITEHDCVSEDCRTFMSEGYQICTQACSATIPCPDLNGTAVTCNAMGVCKPPEPIECDVVP
jgi:hypothetical protein